MLKRLLRGFLFGITTYGFWASGGWGIGPDIMPDLHPLIIETQRNAPAAPPPARLFVSVEGRYAIQQGWLAGEGYEENKIATHGEAVAMVMGITGLGTEDAQRRGIIALDPDGFFDAERELSQLDFALYLNHAFHMERMPSMDINDFINYGILEPDANGNIDPERTVTLGEMARAAYRLRGRCVPVAHD
jgi:hypothetical protein